MAKNRSLGEVIVSEFYLFSPATAFFTVSHFVIFVKVNYKHDKYNSKF